MLLCDVQGGSRKRQVLLSPKTPNANPGHLPISQGMETATGMAPPKRVRLGWMSDPPIYLPNYGCSTSRSYAPDTQNADYRGVSEAAGL